MNFNSMSPFELGESRSKEALPHLIVYLHNGTDNEKRLSASAIIKLIETGINCHSALPFLLKNLKSVKPQVRQYTLKALKGLIVPQEYYGEILEIYNEDDKDYNRKLAEEILANFDGDNVYTESISHNDMVYTIENSIIEENKEVTEKGYIYFIREDYSGRIKIGKTKDINQRMDTFNVKLPFNVELLHVVESNNYHYTEKLFHILFQTKKINGEWFELNDQDVSWIKSNRFTKKIMDSINNNKKITTDNKNKYIKATEKQSSFLTALLEKSQLMLTKPVNHLSATDAAALIAYLYKGEQLPRELLGVIQSKRYFTMEQ